MNATNARKKILDDTTDLQRTGDELRVQLRLALSEAEDRWHRVRDRLTTLTKEVDSASEEALSEMSGAAIELLDEMKTHLEKVRVPAKKTKKA